MAASVGLNTLLFLEKMEHVPSEQEEGKKDYEAELRNKTFEEIARIVFEGIIPAQMFSMEKTAEVEVLYGTPGYMYCLIAILSRLEPWRKKNQNVDDVFAKVTQVLTSVTIQLVKQTTFNAPNGQILVVEFPKGKKKYVGGAHGIFGEVQMIVQAMALVPELRDN